MKPVFFVIFLTTWTFFHASGQTDSAHIRSQLDRGNYYIDKPGDEKQDLDSGLQYIRQAETLSEQIKSPDLIHETKMYLARCYYLLGDTARGKQNIVSAINFFHQKGNDKMETTAWEIWSKVPVDLSDEDKIACDTHMYVQHIKLHDTLNAMGELKEIASIHLSQGNTDLARAELLRVLDGYKSIGYQKLQYTYDLLNELSDHTGDLKNELYYGLAAVQSMTISGDTSYASLFYNRLAATYGTLGNHQESVRWYKKGFDVAKSRDDLDACFVLMVNIVNKYLQMGDVTDAFAFLRQTEKDIPTKKMSHKIALSKAYGDYYAAVHKYDLAEASYLRMIAQLEIASKSQFDISNYMHSYGLISHFYISIGKYEKAGYYLKKIFKLPQEKLTFNNLRAINYMQYQVDSAAGNYLSAIRHYNIYTKIKDSLFDISKNKQIRELAVQYETAQKEQSIKLLEAQSVIQSADLKKISLQRNLTLAGIALVLALAGLAWYSYRSKQKTNLLLKAQKDEIALQNSSLQHLVADKNLLLAEVHHRVKNNLHLIMSLLESQSAFLQKGDALQALQSSQNRIRAISLIHQRLYLSDNVTSVQLDEYLEELLSDLSDSFDTGQRIVFELSMDKVEIGIAKAVPMGLIVNEIIINAIKYAFPDQRQGLITITLKENENHSIFFSVKDNGIGLPDGFDQKSTESLGLRLIRGLCGELNGQMEIQNRNGTQFILVFSNN